ncbi:amidohydrolase family protein [Nonomuraea antimicrobica]|uniref:Amidohydrolase family protein n=1 Tax=Nonomuraea antimicrobica TaxID=561173 RepID=A0ABP7CCW6_9ACTN
MSNKARLPMVPAHTGRYRLVGGTIWDGTGEHLVEDGELGIQGDRIVYVGPRREPADVPRETVTVELGGAYVLPGFIDTHVHLGLAGEESPLAALARFETHSHLRTARTIRQTLEAGITTARDLGGLDAGYRHAIAEGLVDGPRLHLAVSAISPTGGHADLCLPNGTQIGGAYSAASRIADSDDEIRRVVRELVRAEADVLKICTTGGVASHSDSPDDIGVPEHQVRIVVKEAARRQGQPVAAHAHGARGILEAIRGGAASVEHGTGIDAEGIDLMLEHGTFLVPTLSTALNLPEPGHMSPFVYAKRVEWFKIAQEHLARAIGAGVKVALGTDAALFPHGRNLTELGHLVDLGLLPWQALQTGTRNAAELLRLDAELGTIETGKLADLVVTRSHPFRSIHSLADPEAIRIVVQGGRVKKDTDALLTALAA